MIKIFRMHFPKPFVFLVCIEALVLVASFYVGVLASWVDFAFTYDNILEHLPDAISFSFLIIVIMFSLGIYNESIVISFYNIIIRLCVSFVLGFAALSAIFYAIPELLVLRGIMAWTLLSGFAGIVLTHYIFLHAIDLTPLKRRVAVLGTGRQAMRIESLERSGRAFGFVTTGYLAVPGEKVKVPADRTVPSTESLHAYVVREKVGEIVIALENRRNGLPTEALAECAFHGVTITDYLTFWEREADRVDLDALPRNWMLFSSSFPGDRLHRLVKRLFDVAVSLLALVLLFPVLTSTAIAIKLDSPGPVFYRQQRVGRRGESFELLKLRSMRVDAEQDGVPKWAATADDRVTAIGRFIRKVRIDELPQIMNVLRGEMSFVGPRPERPFFVDQLAKEIPFYRERFRVKPGIAGWAQLNFPYGASVADAMAKLEYDLYYVRHFGLMLDTIILLQTIRVVLWPPKTTDGPDGGSAMVSTAQGRVE